MNQTYRAIRIVEGTEINFSYAVWCTGEHEIYDLNVRLLRFRFAPSLTRLLHLGAHRPTLTK